MPPARRGYADTRHGQVHYREAGDGPPLLLLHATPKSSRAFDGLVPHLAGRWRVVAPDTLGFGASDPLPPAATMEVLAESIADLVEALGLGPTAVFGIHTGNKVGAALAAGWPDLVSAFVCCGMTHSIVVDRATRDGAIKDIVAKYFAGEAAASDGSHLLRGWGRTFETLSQTWWSPRVLEAAPLTRAALDEAAGEAIDRIAARNSFDAVYRANFGFDLADALRRIAAPTLILELVTPGEAHLGEQGQACAALMTNARAMALDGSDRDFLERDPQTLAAAIADFLTGTAG